MATIRPPVVRVYKLSADGEWLDKGIGHISLEYMEVLLSTSQTTLLL